MLIDLQLHSTYSDGYLSPTELVDFISKKNIKIASLTDHNTVRGQEEFKYACQKAKIKPITGLELYAKLNSKKMNLLWFNFDPCNPELHNVLRESQIRRRVNVRKHLEIIERKLKLKLDINKMHTDLIWKPTWSTIASQNCPSSANFWDLFCYHLRSCLRQAPRPQQ